MANWHPRDDDPLFAKFLESLRQAAGGAFTRPHHSNPCTRTCSLRDFWRVTVLASEDLVPRAAPLAVWRCLSDEDTQRLTRDAALLVTDILSGKELSASLERVFAGRETDRVALTALTENLKQARKEIQRLRRALR